MAQRTTPDMSGKARELDDIILLYARAGYRMYLRWLHHGDTPPLYEGFNAAEFKRIAELRGEQR